MIREDDANSQFVIISYFSTAVAIRGKDGVVFGVEKLVLSKLYEAGANKRIFHIDRHIGLVSGRTWIIALGPISWMIFPVFQTKVVT